MSSTVDYLIWYAWCPGRQKLMPILLYCKLLKNGLFQVAGPTSRS